MTIQPNNLVSWADPNVSGLKYRQTEIQRQTQALRSKRNEKLRQAARVQSNIVRNQMRLEKTRLQLHSQQHRVNTVENDIGFLQQQIRVKTSDLQKLTTEATKRLRSIYMGERMGWLDMILSAGNLTQMTDQLYFVELIVGNDHELVTTLKKESAALRNQKSLLVNKQVRLKQELTQIHHTKSQIASQISMDMEMKRRLQTDANFYARAERELLSESARIQQRIRALTMVARGGAPVIITGATGSLLWPIRGAITSNFGYRIHPIHRSRLMHTGLDIAGPSGAPVRAADGGVVIEAGWRGGYGKVVMINHGSRNGRNFVTLYGHLSGFAVSRGQSVGKGQTIGYEGSTGYSTGPHLHFEVRLDGAPVNPRPYLP
ncbi:MAG: peptidoglycan DD-metalloendopeptidase family protein [Vampirovibrionales bacterium]|nr:peptidoglycan DD-metalloendopeptidase family protein [Vampirovibrionales bacterium]